MVIVNIKDIAKHANVSIATVSHVINRTRFVSDELIKRVEKAMEELDYQPNFMAGILRRKKTRTIGLVIPDSANMLFADMSKNLEDIFFAKKYNIIICNSAYDIERETEHLKILRSKMVDGIIIIPASTEEYDHILKIKSAGIPVVLLDRKAQDMQFDYVQIENQQAGYLAGKHLLELGHKNIGYIGKVYPHFHNVERKKGLEKALSQSGLSLNKNYAMGGFSYEDGVRAVKELMEINSKITAIFAFNDMNAIGAISGLTDLGLTVPRDISVIGVDDIFISSIFIPKLTTIRYPVRKLVEEVGNVLIERIKQPLFERTKKITLNPKIIIRESTSYVTRISK